MLYTSAEAAKLLKKMREEEESVRKMENDSKEFLASVGEDPESVRPAYDFPETQKKLDEIGKKIRAVKHALNVFNTTHTVPGFDMTVDELLVYIPQLNADKAKLAVMKNRLPKSRENQRMGSGIIDYRYTNYDLKLASAEYDRISDELSRAQTALDVLNNTEKFELDI